VNVLLFGMKHCGKSTLARELARLWRRPCYDVDRLMELQAEEENGRALTVRELYGSLGREGFESLESRTVKKLHEKLLSRSGFYVVALGGGTPLNPRLTPLLKEMGLNVFLEVDPVILWERVERSGTPAFLSGENPRSEFLELYRKRLPVYQAHAELTVSLDDLPPGESLKKLMRAVEERDAG
jgi:shikimate kinase